MSGGAFAAESAAAAQGYPTPTARPLPRQQQPQRIIRSRRLSPVSSPSIRPRTAQQHPQQPGYPPYSIPAASRFLAAAPVIRRSSRLPPSSRGIHRTGIRNVRVPPRLRCRRRLTAATGVRNRRLRGTPRPSVDGLAPLYSRVRGNAADSFGRLPHRGGVCSLLPEPLVSPRTSSVSTCSISDRHRVFTSDAPGTRVCSCHPALFTAVTRSGESVFARSSACWGGPR